MRYEVYYTSNFMEDNGIDIQQYFKIKCTACFTEPFSFSV